MGAVQSYSQQADADLAEATSEHEEPTQEPRPASRRPRLARPYGVQPWERGRRAQLTVRHPQARDEGFEAVREQGLDEGHPDKALPHGKQLPGYHHYAGKPVAEEHAPLDVGPADPYYSHGMSHGVPVPPHHGGRPSPHHDDRAELAATARAEKHDLKLPPDPVAVYIVEQGAGNAPLKRASLRNVPVPAAGADPIVLVPRNIRQTSVRLLNESSSPIRITFDLTNSGGAILPASMTSYLEINTADEICAYQPSGATPAVVSVISQYSVPGGG